MKGEILLVGILGLFSVISGVSVLDQRLAPFGWFAIVCGVGAIGISVVQLVRRRGG